jgi:cobalt/nickel transport system ATP-binding protein
VFGDGTQALCSVNLEIRATERVALVGAKGSGKSTLLAHLNGLLLPQCGTVVVGEYPVKPQHLKAIRNFVGMVFQKPDDQIFMSMVCQYSPRALQLYAHLVKVGSKPQPLEFRD